LALFLPSLFFGFWLYFLALFFFFAFAFGFAKGPPQGDGKALRAGRGGRERRAGLLSPRMEVTATGRPDAPAGDTGRALGALELLI